MIPKIIHYCWLSEDPMPQELIKCVDTWHKYLKGYRFIKWDFSIFPKGKSRWVDQAFEKRKYAFAADYIRLYALYHHGGIYLDSDVEVLKSFDAFLELDDMICYENSPRKGLEVAAIGVSKNRKWVKQCLDYYSDKSFDLGNGILDTKVMPEVVKDI
ncbi:glycosyltransferase family 32 protein [uncultured Duncaniella sp.]|nr:glycosyltransferase [uncultured Duncaniella sp.]